MKTCVFPFRRRKGLEWTIRSRSRWNGVRTPHSSSARSRPRVSYERTASGESERSSCSRTRASKASAIRPAISGMEPQTTAGCGYRLAVLSAEIVIREPRPGDGHLVGFAAGSIREPEEDAEYQLVADVTTPRLDIDVVATAKHFWRRGVARRLVEALEDWAREHGAEIALATTYIESPISIPFWEQGVGYERRAIRYIKRL